MANNYIDQIKTPDGVIYDIQTEATTEKSGLMSADDKAKLNRIADRAQVNTVTGVKGSAETDYRTGNISISAANIGLGNVNNTADANKNVNSAAKLTTARKINGVTFDGTKDITITAAPNSHTHDDRYYTESEMDTKLGNKLDTSLKGAKNGLAELDANGHVPESQLPSYVDDVLEGYWISSAPTAFYKTKTVTNGNPSYSNPYSGESDKIYVDLNTNKTYRWSGTTYVEISASIALGTTSSTAFRGDYGDTAYQHSQAKGNPHGTTKTDLGLGNVDNTADKDKNVKYAKSAGDGIDTITRKGTTFTVTRTDGTTFTFDQQDNNTWNALKGATTSADGTAGYVPAPAKGSANRYLRSDGTWQVPPDNNTTNLTQMSGTLAVAHGGTGATDAATARSNLGLGTLATKNSLSASDVGALPSTTKYAASDSVGGVATSAKTADNASLLKANTGTTYGTSTWRGSITDGTVVWGEQFKNSDIGTDTGDITLWLKKNGNTATLNMSIDGDFYANGNQPVLNSGNYTSYTYSQNNIDTKLNGKLNTSLKGAKSGLAELDETGKIPVSQLPSYVSDVINGYVNGNAFYKSKALDSNGKATYSTPVTGESNKIYVDLDSNKTYRWSGTAFIEISEGVVLGTTANSAYRGDYGDVAYKHSQLKSGNPHGVTKTDVGLGNVDNTADKDKNVSSAKTLTTARTITTNLESTTAASFNGSANVEPGIKGTLGLAHGGTGKTNAKDAANALIGGLTAGSTDPIDDSTYIAEDTSLNGTYVKRKHSYMWNYISGKLSSVTGLTKAEYGGNAATASLATKVKDSNNGTAIDITYSKVGQSSTSWLASWNGYEIGAISPSNITTGHASLLATARTLWGQSFNGGANISGSMTGVGAINNHLNPISDTVTPKSGYTANRSALLIYGDAYGNDSNYTKGSGSLTYGDGGPQIVFNTKNSLTDGQHLSLIYSDNDTVGSGVSLSMVSDQPDAWFIAPHIKATTGITGNLTGNVTGNLTGNVTGNVTGNLTGHSSKDLALAGGTMSGDALISWEDTGNWAKNNSGVTFPVARGGLYWPGQSDSIKLFAEETASDNLNLVMQFADNESNGLSIRNTKGTQTAFISAAGTFTGTFSGNASSATKLQTGRNIQTNLGSESAASFNGTTNVEPGIKGVLPVKHGGTGATDAVEARKNLGVENIRALDTTVNLIADNWTQDSTSGLYTQTVSVAGIKTNSNYSVNPYNDATSASAMRTYIANYTIISCGKASSTEGSITFSTYKKPTANVTVRIIGELAVTVQETQSEEINNVKTSISEVWQVIYPIGSIYMSVNSTSPATLFGGTWEAIGGRFLLGANSSYTAGSTGGESSHILTIDEMPSHNHPHGEYITDGDAGYVPAGSHIGSLVHAKTKNDSKNGVLTDRSDQQVWTSLVGYNGNGKAHNNMPPYLSVYIWKRTA